MIVSELQSLSSTTLTRLSDDLREIGRSDFASPLLEYLYAEPPRTSRLSSRALLYSLWKTYGNVEPTLRSKLDRLHALCAKFLELFGDSPVNVLRAPARINILGEHVDYVSYLPTGSLPFGSREHDMIMLYRAAETDQVRGGSTSEEFQSFSFALGDGPTYKEGMASESDWLSYLFANPTPHPHWGNYVKGSVYFARIKYGERARHGFDFVVDSSIPPKGGASSSSALVVLAGAAIREVNHIGYDLEQLARDSAQAEWFVGTRGGALDHMTICLAKRSHAVRIKYPEHQARLFSLPSERFRWVTFFSHPADKGKEVMLEYNERVAISRLLIPAIIAHWSQQHPDRYTAWSTAIEELKSGSTDALKEIEYLINQLPESLTLDEIAQLYPDAYRECSQAFPALVKERPSLQLPIRTRALHHLGEVKRVASAERILDDLSHEATTEGQVQAVSAMRAIGELLNESHESLRSLCEVSTTEVENLIEIILSDPYTYGARLMGGGFGGNVLALTTEGNAPSLISRVQSEFYEPRHRDGLREGSVMVSTPGEGLSHLNVKVVWREAIEHFNALGWEAERYRQHIVAMLDSVSPSLPSTDVWPIIVAAGKGTRARATGLAVPKPLAMVSGVPALMRVIRTLKAVIADTRQPIVIVSPETEKDVRRTLEGEDVIFAVQPEAHGTGDAVLCTFEQMRDFHGRALVVWGTQPVIRAETLQRTLNLCAIFDEYAMVLPTALKEQPYAPLLRDHRGKVRASRESHLEKARRPRFGETNIALFLLKSKTMFDALIDLRSRYWVESERRYERPGGELGFPNELINYLSKLDAGVLACPIADYREGQGIKSLEDVARC